MKRALVVLVLIGAVAGPARAQRAVAPAARAQLERGLRAYGEHDWSAAIEAFRAGYAIDPHPDFLFPWAQATRLSGDCADALPLYRRALEAARGEADRADIEKLIARCEEEAARERPPQQPEPAPEARPPPRVHVHRAAPVEMPAPPSPWYLDRLGAGLAIASAVALVDGVGFLVAARRADDDAASASTLDGFVADSDTADKRRLIGVISLGAGAGIAAVAVLRYAWVAHGSSREPSLAIAPTDSGAVIGVGGHF